MSIMSKILDKRLTSKNKKQSLSVLKGVPALGLDAFASTAYGTEAALFILLSLGTVRTIVITVSWYLR